MLMAYSSTVYASMSLFSLYSTKKLEHHHHACINYNLQAKSTKVYSVAPVLALFPTTPAASLCVSLGAHSTTACGQNAPKFAKTFQTFKLTYHDLIPADVVCVCVVRSRTKDTLSMCEGSFWCAYTI